MLIFQLNPCLFSESLNCAMSVSFSVRDAEARGFYHWLSIVVSSRDLTQLAASWPFLLRNIQTIISWLQDKAVQVGKCYSYSRCADKRISDTTLNVPQVDL